MSDESLAQRGDTLTARERNVNAIRAAVKLLPSVGDAIDQLAFGPLDDLRLKRVESTLNEILAQVEELGQRPTQTEEFANLFERTVPSIGRAVNEDVRARFRDLLTNAATLPAYDAAWGETDLAAALLTELDAPSLAILAQVARYDGPQPMAIVSKPVCQVVSEGDFDWENPHLGAHRIGYAWPVVEECARRLRERRLVSFASHNGSNGGFGGVALIALGTLLVRWTVSDTAP